MPDYRCYPITSFGSIAGPAQTADCNDDDDAVARARELLPRQLFEVWQGPRKVFPKKLLAKEIAELECGT